MALRLSVAETPGDIPRSFMERLMDERISFDDEFSSRIWRTGVSSFQLSKYPVLSDPKSPVRVEEKTVNVFIDHDESAMTFVLDDKVSVQALEGTDILKGVLPELLSDRDTRAVYRPIRGGPPKLERIVSKTKGVVFESEPGDKPSEWVDLKKVKIDFEDFLYITRKKPATLKADMKNYMERKDLDLGYVDEYLSKGMRGAPREKTEARKRFYGVLVREVKKMQGIKAPENTDKSSTGTTTSVFGGSGVKETKISFSGPSLGDKPETGIIGFDDFVGITGRASGTANAALKRNGIDREAIPLDWASNYINNMQRVTDEDRIAARARLEQHKAKIGGAAVERQLFVEPPQTHPNVNGSGGAQVAEQAVAPEIEPTGLPAPNPTGEGIAPEPVDIGQADSDIGIVEGVAPAADLEPEAAAEELVDSDIGEPTTDKSPTDQTDQPQTKPKGYTLFEFLNLSGLGAAEARGVIETEGIDFHDGKLDGLGVEKYLENVGKLPVDHVEPETGAEALDVVEELIEPDQQPVPVLDVEPPTIEDLEIGADRTLDFVEGELAVQEHVDEASRELESNSDATAEEDDQQPFEDQDLNSGHDVTIEGTNKTTANRSEVYRPYKAARILGLNEEALQDLVRTGRLVPVTLEGKYSGNTYFKREDVLKLMAEQVEMQTGRKVYIRSEAVQVLGGDGEALRKWVSKRAIRTYQDRFFDMDDVNKLADKLGAKLAIDNSEESLGQEGGVEAALAVIEEHIRNPVISDTTTQISTASELVTDNAQQTLISNFTEIAKRYGVTEDEARDHIRRVGLKREHGGYKLDLVDNYFAKLGINPVIPAAQNPDTDKSLLSAPVAEVVQDPKPKTDEDIKTISDRQDPRKYPLNTARKMLGASWDDVHRILSDGGVAKYKGGDVDADQLDLLLEKRRGGENLVDKEKSKPPEIGRDNTPDIILAADPKPASPSPTISTQDDIKPVRRIYTDAEGSSALGVNEEVFRSIVGVHGIPLEDGGYDANRVDRLRDELARFNPRRAVELIQTPAETKGSQQPATSHIKDIARTYGLSRSKTERLLREGGVENVSHAFFVTRKAEAYLSGLGYNPIDLAQPPSQDTPKPEHKALKPAETQPAPVIAKDLDTLSLGETAEFLGMTKLGVMDLVNNHQLKMKIVDGKICFEKGAIERFVGGLPEPARAELPAVQRSVFVPETFGAAVVLPDKHEHAQSAEPSPITAPSTEQLESVADSLLQAVGDQEVSPKVGGEHSIEEVDTADLVDQHLSGIQEFNVKPEHRQIYNIAKAARILARGESEVEQLMTQGQIETITVDSKVYPTKEGVLKFKAREFERRTGIRVYTRREAEDVFDGNASRLYSLAGKGSIRKPDDKLYIAEDVDKYASSSGESPETTNKHELDREAASLPRMPSSIMDIGADSERLIGAVTGEADNSACDTSAGSDYGSGPDQNQTFSLRSASLILGRPEEYVMELIKSGKIKQVGHTGNQSRFSRKDLIKLAVTLTEERVGKRLLTRGQAADTMDIDFNDFDRYEELYKINRYGGFFDAEDVNRAAVSIRESRGDPPKDRPPVLHVPSDRRLAIRTEPLKGDSDLPQVPNEQSKSRAKAEETEFRRPDGKRVYKGAKKAKEVLGCPDGSVSHHIDVCGSRISEKGRGDVLIDADRLDNYAAKLRNQTHKTGRRGGRTETANTDSSRQRQLYRQHDIQRKYGLGAHDSHVLLEESGIEPIDAQGTSLYPVDQTDAFFRTRGIAPVVDGVDPTGTGERNRGQATLPSIENVKKPAGSGTVISPTVAPPQARQPEPKPGGGKVVSKQVVSASPSFGFLGTSKPDTSMPKRPELPDIYQPLRDLFVQKLERERRAYFGEGDKTDMTTVLRQGGTIVNSDSGTEFVTPEDIERVFGFVYERVRAMLAWQGLETDPIKGVNRWHLGKFIDKKIESLNPDIAERMKEEFGYKPKRQDTVEMPTADASGVMEVDTPHPETAEAVINPALPASTVAQDSDLVVETESGENVDAGGGQEEVSEDIITAEETGYKAGLANTDPVDLVDDKPQEDKGDENQEAEQDYQAEYYSGAFRGSVSLGKLRSLVEDKKIADRILNRYGQEGRVDNVILARIGSGLQESELNQAQRDRILLDMGLPTGEKGKGVVERYCPEIGHVGRERVYVAFDSATDYKIGDLARIGVEHNDLDLIKQQSSGEIPGWRAAEILVDSWKIEIVRELFGYKGSVGQIREQIGRDRSKYERGRRS
ncbi:MAG: helix-turn-helix domain-containing protein [Candidatus Aenigmarchaeota archaeon]|nr:helix-turn-helix domain-containing protein [Candidatus Aenigmarchaeota archaeon]